MTRPTDEQLARLELEAQKWNRISDGAMPIVVAAIAELRARREEPLTLELVAAGEHSIVDIFEAAIAFVGAENRRLRARHDAEIACHRHSQMWQQQCENAWVDGCGCLSRSIEGACPFCRPLFEAEAKELATRQESRERFGELQSAVYEHFKAIDIAADAAESDSQTTVTQIETHRRRRTRDAQVR